MKSLSHAFKAMLLAGASTSLAQITYAQKSAIDTERENIIIFSRQGNNPIKSSHSKT